MYKSTCWDQLCERQMDRQTDGQADKQIDSLKTLPVRAVWSFPLETRFIGTVRQTERDGKRESRYEWVRCRKKRERGKQE